MGKCVWGATYNFEGSFKRQSRAHEQPAEMIHSLGLNQSELFETVLTLFQPRDYELLQRMWTQTGAVFASSRMMMM